METVEDVCLTPPDFCDYGIPILEKAPNQLIRELMAYRFQQGRHGKALRRKMEAQGIDVSGLKSAFQHMINCIALIWPNEVHLIRRGYRNTPFLKIIHFLCEYEDIGIAGNAGSGKTFGMAIWSIVDWLCAPDCTSTFIASTTLESSSHRLWGKIIQMFKIARASMIDRYGEGMAMGHLVEYKKCVAFEEPSVNDEKTDKDFGNAIKALAFPAGNEGLKAVETTRGRHNTRVRLLVDELAEMDIYVLDARVNLKRNPDFVFCGTGNPSSRGNNPHKELCQPSDPRGWDAVTMYTKVWKTRTGMALHLAGDDSPNFQCPDEDDPPYDYYLTRKEEQDILNTVCFGNKESISYYRNIYGWWPGTDTELTVISKSAIAYAEINKEPRWQTPQIYLAGFDPAFTSGGDRCSISLGKIGADDSGRRVLFYLGTTDFQGEVGVSFEQSIARQLVKKCIDSGIKPHQFGMDISADGGKMMREIIIEWNKYDQSGQFVVPISSMGKATERVVSAQDTRLCCDAYDRLVTEYWFAVLSAISTRTIYGMDLTAHAEMIEELCSRLFYQKGSKVSIEPKKLMKERIKKSPDRADSFVYLVEMARRNGLEFITEGEESENLRKAREFEEKNILNRGKTEGYESDWSREEKESELYAYSGTSGDPDLS